MAKSRCCLVVDDDYGSRTGITSILEILNHSVLGFDNGQEVLEHIRDLGPEFKYDVAFVDLSMQEPGGTHVMRELKIAFPSRPVVCISGYDLLGEKGLNCGDYQLQKPVNRSEFDNFFQFLDSKEKNNP